MGQVRVLPDDELNRTLVAHVAPPDWCNPTPAGRYNLVVIGAGTAGLITAAGAAGLGARVALVERHLMGGDCLNVGCVPSKTVIRSSRLVAEARDGERFGVRVGAVETDFAAVMRRMRTVRTRISANDAAARYRDEKGVDVYLGAARFSGPDSVEVGGQTLRFKKAVIATGGRAAEPPIPGLAAVGYLTNETVFTLTERPARLAVIGAGPIGCELAQAFRRLGSEVVLLHDSPHILNREDADAAEIVQRAFVREGVALVLGASVVGARRDGADKVLRFRRAGGAAEEEVRVDEILVAAGRVPNVADLDLERVGVDYDARRGVLVDDRLRTSNARIYACGDVCTEWKFTHAADFAARIVIQNALFFGRRRLSGLIMPWCTYTDPEIAHVGLYEHEAGARGIAFDAYVRPFHEVDRAIADGEEDGFVKILTRKGGDQILGATIVARHAGDLISALTQAMVGKVGLGSLANVIHPYPTQAEAIRQAGDLYNRTRLTPTVKRLFAALLALTR